MDTWNLDPNEVLKSEEERHSNSKKQQLTINRKKYRQNDIKTIKKLFPNVCTVLCIGCRHDSEVQDFLNNKFIAIGIDIATESDFIAKIDAHKLNEFEFNKFDFVYASHSLEHMYDPKLVMRNIKNLNPQGIHITLPFQNKNQGSILKHATLFEIMKVDDITAPIEEIINYQKSFIKDMNHPIWKDFDSLGNFELLHYEYRQLNNIKQKEISFCLKFGDK